MPPPVTELDATKSRLLAAAGEEFAEHGFERATVRRICERAGTNLAAVNYHFGDKEQLYVRAVLEAHRCGSSPLSIEVQSGPPSERLRAFVRHYLGEVLAAEADPEWHRGLMLRELLNPSKGCEVLVREVIRSRFEVLRGILAELAPEADPRRLTALAFSVVGQCLHYKVGRPVMEQLLGREVMRQFDLDYLVEHIAGVMLHGLGSVSKRVECGNPEVSQGSGGSS